MTDDQRRLAGQALETRDANAQAPHHPPARDHADEGMTATPRPDQPPSGAFDAEGQRPAMERSRRER